MCDFLVLDTSDSTTCHETTLESRTMTPFGHRLRNIFIKCDPTVFLAVKHLSIKTHTLKKGPETLEYVCIRRLVMPNLKLL